MQLNFKASRGANSAVSNQTASFWNSLNLFVLKLNVRVMRLYWHFTLVLKSHLNDWRSKDQTSNP